MSRYGAANYCAVCEKTIPHSARCVWCRRGLCYNCKCGCPLSQPNSTPLNPKARGWNDIAAIDEKLNG